MSLLTLMRDPPCRGTNLTIFLPVEQQTLYVTPRRQTCLLVHAKAPARLKAAANGTRGSSAHNRSPPTVMAAMAAFAASAATSARSSSRRRRGPGIVWNEALR
jgi:hypothetical protein